MKQIQSPPALCFTDQANSPPRKYAVPQATRFSYPPTQEDWTRVQELIHRLYVSQKQPLQKVRDDLKSHGFIATDRMIKARLKTWGYMKNAKKEDWGLLAVLHHNRKQKGKLSTIFEIHGHRKTIKDLQRFIRNQATSPDDFLAAHLNQGYKVPDYIRALTPEAEDNKDSPPSTHDSPADPSFPSPNSTSPTKQESLERPIVPHHSTPDTSSSYHDTAVYKKDYHRRNYSGSNALKAAYPSQMSPVCIKMSRHHCQQINHHHHQQNQQQHYHRQHQLPLPPTPPSPLSHCPTLPHICRHEGTEPLEVYSNQILHPSPIKSLIGADDLKSWILITPRQESPGTEPVYDTQYTCSRCNQPSYAHFPSLDNFDPRQDNQRIMVEDSNRNDNFWHLPVSTRGEGAWIWVSRCFLACMCLSRGDEKLGQVAINDAAKEFERLLEKKDELLLTAALLMITILHTHDQDEICFRILNSTKAVTDRMLPENDPIRETMAYYTASANLNIKASGISCADLESVYYKLRQIYGANHPYAITAHHNYGWLLRHENDLDAAEHHLREAHQASLQHFGKYHMQTVTSLSVLAGCFRPQENRLEECIRLYREVVPTASDILGGKHPYVLRLKFELATQLKKISGTPGVQSEVVKLYKEVMEGRATMLGRSHNHTICARKDYEEILRLVGRWINEQGRPSKEQKEVEERFARDSVSNDKWERIGENDEVMIEASSRSIVKGRYYEDENGRKWSRSNTRTPSPSTSNDFAGY